MKRKFEFFKEKKGRLLYIFADAKRLRVIEFLDGKKKVLLNKEREVKKVKAGGMSKKRYRRKYGEVKKRTSEWHERQLRKLEKRSYDKVKLICRNKEWKENILNILIKKIKWKEIIVKKDEKN